MGRPSSISFAIAVVCCGMMCLIVGSNTSTIMQVGNPRYPVMNADLAAFEELRDNGLIVEMPGGKDSRYIRYVLAAPATTGSEEMQSITAGDVVRLKSGGPAMTSSTTTDKTPDDLGRPIIVTCQWFLAGEVKEGKFPLASLELIPKE